MRTRGLFSSLAMQSNLTLASLSIVFIKRFPRIFTLVTLTFLLDKNLFGQQITDRNTGHSYIEDEKLSEQIVFLTYDDQFNQALQLVDKMIKDKPNSIQWKYFRAMIYWRELMVLGWGPRSPQKNPVDRIGDELLSLKNIVDSVSSGSSENVNALFYKGAIYGYLGMYYAGIKDEPLKAIGVGKDGIDFHKKVIQLV